MKRAILTLSAAILLLASAPALADGYRSRHHGYGNHGHHVKPHHFGEYRRGYHVLPRFFGGLIYRPFVEQRHYGGHDRPRFRPHGDRHFKRYPFGGRRHGYRY